jgi:hypothetical protein
VTSVTKPTSTTATGSSPSQSKWCLFPRATVRVGMANTSLKGDGVAGIPLWGSSHHERQVG